MPLQPARTSFQFSERWPCHGCRGEAVFCAAAVPRQPTRTSFLGCRHAAHAAAVCVCFRDYSRLALASARPQAGVGLRRAARLSTPTGPVNERGVRRFAWNSARPQAQCNSETARRTGASHGIQHAHRPSLEVRAALRTRFSKLQAHGPSVRMREARFAVD